MVTAEERNAGLADSLRRWIDFDSIAAQCVRWDLRHWIEPLGRAVDSAAENRHRGQWSELVVALEEIRALRERGLASEVSADELSRALKRLSPWEKGPWQIGPVGVDAQWRSDWKWERIADLVDWRGQVGIDVGGGNGYYAGRMIERGSGVVWVVDPTPTAIGQGLAAAVWSDRKTTPSYLPLADTSLPVEVGETFGRPGVFDFALSMGVLYHHPSPLEHLRRMAGLVRRGGVVIVETIYMPDDEGRRLSVGGGGTAWTPPGRYASMRNVWMIPTIDGLRTWLGRVGLKDVEVCHRGVTSLDEQRSTEWSAGHSLTEALNPDDQSRTVEGHPRPHRAVVRCRRLV